MSEGKVLTWFFDFFSMHVDVSTIWRKIQSFCNPKWSSQELSILARTMPELAYF